ncbi:hypothetical protein [Aurantibacillus circumpalustris]|uniref:hypothetical protein n=1 Tax=Aurantibacillus circumpalustris TaxID=3036359 RepID=UPI00295B07BC|nr:hypothetical protein [Aurantibacillus circumpalustris]
MLRDKYSFKQSRSSALAIAEGYKNTLTGGGSPLQYLLAMNLQSFMRRLWLFGNSNHNKVKKISMNKQEALALHIAYELKLINNECPFVTEIFTEIDRTI